MITERQLAEVRRYCCEDISKIENYDKALTDLDVRYDCHHRLEIGKNGELISRGGLIEHGLYYHRPASELIFITRSEHTKLHNQNKQVSAETRRKLSEASKGNKNSLGHHQSDESRRKISEARTGKTQSEETRRKISESRKAYYTKKKMTKE